MKRGEGDGWQHLEVFGLFLGCTVMVMGCLSILAWAWIKGTGRYVPPTTATIGLRVSGEPAALEGWV